MSYERKQYVQEAYRRLESTGGGDTLRVSTILDHFDPSVNPTVVQGHSSSSQVTEQLLASLENGNDSNGIVLWPEFLDYFKAISISIDDDNTFELLLRNSFTFGQEVTNGQKPQTNSRRVLVVHNDGTQEVVEFVDNSGISRYDYQTTVKKLNDQGIYDIKDIQF